MADSILILDVACNSMGGGSWKDQIVCTQRKNGTFSLRTRKTGDDGPVFSPAGISRIRSAEVFVQGLIKMGNLLNYEIDAEEIVGEICEELGKLDREFAQKV